MNRGQIIFGDAIYFRSSESFYSMEMSLEQRKEKLLKMVQVLSLYGFFDAAIDYINHDFSPLNNVEKQSLCKILSDRSKIPIWQKLLFNNIFAGKLGRFFKLIGNILSFPSNTTGWGTDYNGIDGRYPYFRKEGNHFKKS